MKKTTVTSLIVFLSITLSTFSQSYSQSCFVYYNVKVTACDVYNTPGGKVITNSGFSLDTIKSTTACDTVLFITSTINQNQDTIIVIARCDSFVTATGKILNTSGIYFDTIPTSKGCDSAISYAFTKGIHLEPKTIKTACDSFISPSGKTWYNSGNYYDTVNSVIACDTVYNIELKLNKTTFDTINTFNCFQYYTLSGKRILSSGIYYDTLIGNNSCDKIVTYYVSIGTAYKKIPLEVYCDSLVSTTGKVFRTSGIHFDTIAYPTGCDTIFEYELKIGPFLDTIRTVACDSFISPSGKIITSNTIVNDTIMGKNCDSVVYNIDIRIGKTTNDTNIVFACDTFYSSITNNYWTSSGINLDTIYQGKLGCDSSIYYKIEIGMKKNSASVSSCWSYTLPSGSKTITSSGIYMDTLTTSAGCDSILTLTVEINKADTTVFKRPGELIAFISGASYQWLDCNAGFAPVAGETNQTFLPSVLGSYALEVQKFGCIDTSSCYLISSYAGIEENDLQTVKVFPNPVIDKLTIAPNENEKILELILLDLKGKEVYRQKASNQSQVILNMDEIGKGVYVLKVITEEREKSLKIVKQ